MAGSKRERELQRKKLARQQQEAAAAAAARRKRIRILGAVGGAVVVVLAVVGIAYAIGHSGGGSTSAAAGTPNVHTATSFPTVASPSTVGVRCKPVNGQKPSGKQYTGPTNGLIQNGQYSENMTTNCGLISFTMDAVHAPNTTKSMAFLSDHGFFNNTICHRLTTGQGNYIIQCGDPKGDGTGGPGYKLQEENLPPIPANGSGSVVYPRGTVAMANAGPGTTGSQFFIVYKDSDFPPDYTVLGHVTKGMNIIDYVASKGTADGSQDGRPKQPLQITNMVSSASIEQAAPQ